MFVERALNSRAREGVEWLANEHIVLYSTKILTQYIILNKSRRSTNKNLYMDY